VDRAAYEKARALEKAGKAEEALRAFRDAGAVDDVGRLLAAARRYREAGEVLFGSLQVRPGQVGQLEPALKKRALSAAIWLAKGGEAQVAVELFVALGERQRAIETLQRKGDQVGAARLLAGERLDGGPSLLGNVKQAAVSGAATSMLAAQKLEGAGKLDAAFDAYVQLRKYAEAARVAKRLGRVADAAQLYADAGLPFEAAKCYLEAGDTGKALDNLVRVPRDDASYRSAAVRAVQLASALNVLGFELEHFVGPFVAKGPQDDAEVEAFYQLARVYLRHDFAENAKEALRKIEARSPGYRDVRKLLEGLDEQSRATPMVAAAVLEDAAHHHRKSLPRLPDLDDLPGLDAPHTVVRSGAVVADAEIVTDEPPMPARSGAADGFTVGATIAGRYRLDETIGQGGMAIVFRARDLELEEDVALKVFTLQITSESAVARFKQELKLSRQLVHPNITRLYDIGLHAGHRYISMELLRGESLKQRIQRPMPFAEALDYLIQACRGLQAAHDAGVIHRDVKPDNFFVTEGGILKVMDFGIAKHHAAPGVTVAGSIAGTPQYMSPEQVSNFSTVTQATDLYALGICAYELFTGAPPFTHAELVPLLMMHVNQAPEPPRKKNPAVPEELERVILRLLAKDPARRHPSCGALADELLRIKQNLPR
jgi:eukaryotic-like serine/threonine-protein kinase